MRYLCLSLLLCLCACIPAKESASEKKALAKFKIAPGYRLELVATHPQIQSPVAMSFDEDGRLWVVEMIDYPNGPAPGKPPMSRIKILEDQDGDGRYEKSKVFADRLRYANALHHYKDGALVPAAPHVLFLKNVNDKAASRKVLFEGFAAKNPQLRVSHPKLGLDGWVYLANGLRGGAVKKAGSKDKPIDISGRDFRFDPINGQYEAISGMGQYGNCFDDWGHRFVCDNRHHLRHIVFPNRYLKRNPFLALRTAVDDISVLDDGPLSSGGKIYPLSKNWTTSNLHAGRFTAACGVYIYRGDLMPDLVGNAFTCDPTGNIVHREILKQKGATFEARPARKGVEFLATPDEHFRPVFLSTGPDGALYVVDMMRAVIEHPQFMPKELKNRPDLVIGREKGRIWRIVPNDHKTKAVRPNLSKATTSDLVKLLAHPNGWYRTTAQRLILTQSEKKAVPHLKEMLTSKSPQARAHALWLLNSLNSLEESSILKALEDRNPRVREQAVKLAESAQEKHSAIRKKLLSMANDDDSQVRFQLALTLGEVQDDHLINALAKLAVKSGDDAWTRNAIVSAVPSKAGSLFVELWRMKKAPTLIRDLVEVVGARHQAGEVGMILSRIRETDVPTLELFESLLDGMSRRGLRLASFVKSLPKGHEVTRSRVDFFMKQAAKAASEGKEIGARLLAQASWEIAKKPLLAILEKPKSSALHVASIRSLAQHGDPSISKILMQQWGSATPTIRRELTDAMLRRTDRIQYLLTEIEAERVKPGDIDRIRQRRLLTSRNREVRAKAQKLFQSALPEERKKVLAKYQAALKLKGEPKRGREVFKNKCATCHQIGDIGVTVGPVISDTRTKTKSGLLTDILNPNQAIDNNYINYVIDTRQGQTLSGIIIAETASSITLQQPENKTSVILRQDIEEMRSTGVSLMPEGLEKEINLQAMADLLSFLKNWRYLDGRIPIRP